MSPRNLAATLGAALAWTALAGPVAAGVTVRVTVTGTVSFNQINSGTLGNFVSGNTATLTFLLDSDDFQDSGNFPTRGYVIEQVSFTLGSGPDSIGLENPFPAGQTPYFVLRDNDPAVDGFFTATSLDFPVGVPLDQTGIFTQFRNNYSVTYQGSTLSSLDILGALGTYGFGGLQVFGWTIDDGPANAMAIDFTSMTLDCPGSVASYCTAGTTASGCNASIAGTGLASRSAPAGFVVTTSGVEGSKQGILFWGAAPTAVTWGAGSSWRCVAAPLRRTPVQNSGGTSGACDGSLVLDFNTWMTANPSKAPGAGTRAFMQAWFRDPPSAKSTSLSDALEFDVCP